MTLAVRSAEAQAQQTETVYVTGSVTADIKRFSGDPATNVLDGTAAGGGVAVGTRLGARWDVEVGVDASAASEVVEPHSVTIRRSVVTLYSTTENRMASVSALVRYRSAPRGRVQIGYLGGLLFLRLEREFTTEGPSDTPAGFIPKPLTLVNYGTVPVVGVDVKVAVTNHVSIVPAFHASGFDLRDVGGVVLRPRIGVRWAF